MILVSPLQVNFTNNKAQTVGGAIYVDNSVSRNQCDKSGQEPLQTFLNTAECFDPIEETSIYCTLVQNICFFTYTPSMLNISLIFVDNTAGKAGTVLYGGQLDDCTMEFPGESETPFGNRIITLRDSQSLAPLSVFENISVIVENLDYNDTSHITSDPYRVCFCDIDGFVDCSLHNSVNTVRGKKFSLSVVTVGQGNNTVPSSVRIDLDTSIQFPADQSIQATKHTCTNITYSLFSSNNFTILTLYPDGPCRDIGIARREIEVTFLPCPDGFMLSGSECICEERLQHFTTSCSVDDSKIQRSRNTFWIRALYSNDTYEGLIIHPAGCPAQYCMETPVRVGLDDIDTQCDHNHSGTLCGSCKENFSLALGSLHCLKCSNSYLGLILPFALAGISLIVVLLSLPLTVVHGTLNGLIFYANAVQVNKQIFLPPGETNILTIFIAWLNLDLGIETCFYNGMDAYLFTWLQYLFPFYIWFLIGSLIVLCRYSPKLTRILGNCLLYTSDAADE